jgi:hypothetical protein
VAAAAAQNVMPTPVFNFRISSEGRTRLVFVLGAVALKLARGARGRRSNLYEHDLYGRVSERRRVMRCPILWCDPLGLMAAVRTARPLSEEERDHFWDTDGFPDWDWEPGSPDNSHPFEWKASDWGELDDGRAFQQNAFRTERVWIEGMDTDYRADELIRWPHPVSRMRATNPRSIAAASSW